MVKVALSKHGLVDRVDTRGSGTRGVARLALFLIWEKLFFKALADGLNSLLIEAIVGVISCFVYSSIEVV